jgi:hypothetical protein
LDNAGRSNAERIAMIAMTTSKHKYQCPDLCGKCGTTEW